MTLQVQIAPLSTLEELLPRVLQNVSLSRAQIAIDQLRSVIQSSRRDRIVLLTAQHHNSQETPLAAVVAIQHAVQESGTATIVHAGETQPIEQSLLRDVQVGLGFGLEREFARRKIRFAQWATDLGSERDSVGSWCAQLAFEWIGDLDYLQCDVPSQNQKVDVTPTLHFDPVNLEDASDWENLVRLVDRTYAQTLDCPRLAKHRTAAETLQAYRNAPAFAPRGWFRVTQRNGGSLAQDVGVLLLGFHGAQNGDANSEDSTSRDTASEGGASGRVSDGATSSDSVDAERLVVELVYMGIVPTARGSGFGQRILDQAFQVAITKKAQRIILAVDQLNAPARRLYDAAGMAPMLSESVWVRSLE